MDSAYTKTCLDTKDAIFLAAMVYQAYQLFEVGTLVLPKGYELQYTIRAIVSVELPTEEVFGFIAQSKNKIIIAFRGYASYPVDILAGYDIFQVPYPYVEKAGVTHRGFTCIYQSTRDEIIKQLNRLSTNKELIITGHNYGGAIAVLAALDITVNTEFKNPVVYTYGSLRAGDPEFAARFDKKVKNSVRIFNVHDPNPTWPYPVFLPPLTANGLYYRHVKTRYPVSFQLNDTPRNQSISCYFKNLSRDNPEFAARLCRENPGFCPNTGMCFPFLGTCKCSLCTQ